MSVPDYQTLMLPVLRAASRGEARIGETVDLLAGQLGLTAEERTALLPSGKQTVFSNRVHWAKTYLAKAGLIEATRRGHFKITKRGEQVSASKPQRIDNAFPGRFDEFNQFTEKSTDNGTEECNRQPATPALVNQTETPDEIMRVAHRQNEISLAQELLGRIQAAPPDFFERLIVSLLLSMGFGGSALSKNRLKQSRNITASIPWLFRGTLYAFLITYSVSSPCAAIPECGARTPVDHLVCSSDVLRRAAGNVEQALRRRLSNVPSEQRSIIIELQERWLTWRLAYCGVAAEAPVLPADSTSLSRCLAEVYRRQTEALAAECQIDQNRTLADFAADHVLWHKTIPAGFSIIGGIQRYTIAWSISRAPILLLPSQEISPSKNEIAGIHSGGTDIALCRIRSPRGDEWLVTRAADGSLAYVSAKDVEP